MKKKKEEKKRRSERPGLLGASNQPAKMKKKSSKHSRYSVNATLKCVNEKGVYVRGVLEGRQISRNDLTRLTQSRQQLPEISKLFFLRLRSYYYIVVPFLLPLYNSFIPSFLSVNVSFPTGASHSRTQYR